MGNQTQRKHKAPSTREVPGKSRPVREGSASSGSIAVGSPGDAERSAVSFETNSLRVLGKLQHALADLLRALPNPTDTASEVERALGIDYKLGWQVHRIATVKNPLAGGTSVPARVSMRRLLNAASRRKVPMAVINRVSDAFDAFERLVEVEAGDRDELESMLAAFVPEARQKRELEIKRAAFKAASQVKGITMEAQVGAFILHPSADPMKVDRATFSAYVGLRRLRADAHIGFATVSGTTPGSAALTLDRVPTDGLHSILLPSYCSEPIPKFEVGTFGTQTRYSVAGEDVGMGAAVELVMAELRPAAMKRYRLPDGRSMSGVMNTTDIPMKRQVTDIFLHRDVYPGSRPQLGVFDTVPRGLATALDDPAREADRLPFEESIEPIEGGLSESDVPALPRYVEMLRHVCERLGWDAGAFRGLRLDVEYPVYGGQYMIGFELPEAPGEG